MKCTCGSADFNRFEAEAIHWMVCVVCGRWWKPRELELYARHGIDWAKPA